MLAFYLNNEPFAISEDNAIRLTWRNPACNLENFPGDVGLGIDIPANEINRTLLGNPETFDRYSKENTREFEGFEIRFAGVVLMSGTYIIETASNESYSGWLRSNVGNLGKEHREKFIYDSISFNQEKTFENKADYNPLTDDYACPKIFNPEFFKEKGSKIELPKWTEDVQYYGTEEVKNITETEDLTEAFRQTSNWYVNAPQPGGGVNTLSSEIDTNTHESVEEDLDVSVVSPMLFLNYVLKTILKDARFAIDNNFIADDEDLRKLLIYNNYDITRMLFEADTTELYTYNYNPALGEEQEVTRTSQMRPIFKISRDYQGPFFYKSLLPKIKLKDWLLGVQNLLNVFFHFRPGRKVVDIIDRESVLSGITIDVEKYLVGFWAMNEKKDSTLKFSYEHDDNDTFFADFFENLDDRRIDEREPVQNWEALKEIADPKPGEIRKLLDGNEYVQYALIKEETTDPLTGTVTQISHLGWEVISIGFQNAFYNYGKDEEEEISTNFSTLFLSDENNTFTHQKGNIESEKYSWESFSPRMLFYWGTNYGYYETANVSLDWEKDTTGLLDSRWKNWSRFWATRQPVETRANFSLGMLDYVINNIYRKFRAKEGEFIIEEISTEFRTNQVGISEIKGYKVNYAPNVYNLSDVWSTEDVIWIDETFDMQSDFDSFEPLI